MYCKTFKLLLLPLFLVLAFGHASQGQLQEDYSPVLSHGKVPQDFVLLSGQKYDRDTRDIKDMDVKYRERKARSEFSLQANFAIDQLLLSGQIMFNDDMSNYICKVADHILRDEPELRDELRFYAVRSSSANAFSTQQGIIFVTTGLLAQLQNEAQLGYVLAHEIVHYENDHNVDTYLMKEDIMSNRTSYNVERAVDILSGYSKDLELEADHEGFQRFAKSGYDLDQALTTFDVLHYSYLPFDEVPFDFDCLESEFFEIPERLKLDSVRAISVDFEDYDDSQKTHPNIATRKEKIFDLIADTENIMGRKFINPEEEFIRMRDVARFELIRLNMINSSYVEAIYNCHLLSRKYPDNQFLKRSMAKSLYGLAAYKTADEEDQILYDYKDIEGESQKVYFLFSVMGAEPLTVLALRHVIDILEQNPNDRFMNNLKDDLIKKLVVEHNFGFNNLKSIEEKEEVVVQDTIQTVEQEETNNKYKQISLERESMGKGDEKFNYHEFAFSDLLDDQEFKSSFSHYEAIVEKEQNQPENSYQERKQADRAEQRRERREKIHGKALGVDKIFLVNPLMMHIKKNEPDLLRSEKQQLELNALMSHNAELSGINCYNVNAKDFGAEDAVDFNNNMFFKAWLAERMSHGEIDIIPLESDFLYSLIDKYGIKHLSVSGLFVNDIRHKKRWRALLCMLIPYTWPFGIYLMMKPGYDSVYFNFVFDLETGEEILSDLKETDSGFHRASINRWAYDQFWQLSRDPSQLE